MYMGMMVADCIPNNVETQWKRKAMNECPYGFHAEITWALQNTSQMNAIGLRVLSRRCPALDKVRSSE